MYTYIYIYTHNIYIYIYIISEREETQVLRRRAASTHGPAVAAPPRDKGTPAPD